MSNKNHDKRVEMQIMQIQERSFSLDDSIWTLDALNRDALEVQIGFKFEPIPEKNLFSVWIKAHYRYSVADEKKKLASIEVATLFEIVNMEAHIEAQGEQFNDKSDLVPMMLNIAIGSTRGFIASKVAGTILAKYPLPIMDIQEVLSNINRSNG